MKEETRQILEKVLKQKEIQKEAKEEKLSILLLLPFYGMVPSHSVQCLINLLTDAKEYYNINYISILDLYVGWARTKLFTQTLEYINTGTDLDAIFFLDQDHLHYPNDFMNLVNSFINSDYDVLGAYYVYKDETHRVVAYKINDDESIENLEDLKPNQGIIKVDCIGLGYCLMKPEFLKRMYGEYGETPFMDYYDYDKKKFNGEDVAFFKHAKKIGAKVGINTDIRIGHIGASVK